MQSFTHLHARLELTGVVEASGLASSAVGMLMECKGLKDAWPGTWLAIRVHAERMTMLKFPTVCRCCVIARPFLQNVRAPLPQKHIFLYCGLLP